MLTKYGYIEDAMKMITKTEAPSWGYWVETMGYSTLPETWTLSPKFADASLNHVFMGDVSAWMMNQLAGINHDDSAPGFRHIRITPHFVKELDWAKGEYHSVRGRIASEWKREGDQVMLTVTIPADCSADIVVGDQTETVSAGTHTFSYPVEESGTIYIACGPILYKNDISYIGEERKIRVPNAFFKVILAGLDEGKPRAIGFIYKNAPGNNQLDHYVNSVDQVERITGLDFFSQLPDDVENEIESNYNLNQWR